jgi:hypothetical protein
MSKQNTNTGAGFMVIPHSQGRNRKPQGPFRNMKAVRNWTAGRLHEFAYVTVIDKHGGKIIFQGEGK